MKYSSIIHYTRVSFLKCQVIDIDVDHIYTLTHAHIYSFILTHIYTKRCSHSLTIMIWNMLIYFLKVSSCHDTVRNKYRKTRSLITYSFVFQIKFRYHDQQFHHVVIISCIHFFKFYYIYLDQIYIKFIKLNILNFYFILKKYYVSKLVNIYSNKISLYYFFQGI